VYCDRYFWVLETRIDSEEVQRALQRKEYIAENRR
jgi:hypothetical protein